jgi:hypothetical protein
MMTTPKRTWEKYEAAEAEEELVDKSQYCKQIEGVYTMRTQLKECMCHFKEHLGDVETKLSKYLLEMRNAFEELKALDGEQTKCYAGLEKSGQSQKQLAKLKTRSCELVCVKDRLQSKIRNVTFNISNIIRFYEDEKNKDTEFFKVKSLSLEEY